MTDLETEIRDALRTRVQDVTSERLRHAEHDEVVIPLQAIPTKHRRHSSILLTAAAVAAALAVTTSVLLVARPSGSGVPGSSESAPVQAEPMPFAPLTAANLTIPFSVPASAGWSLIQVHVVADSTALTYTHGPAEVAIDTKAEVSPPQGGTKKSARVKGRTAEFYESLFDHNGVVPNAPLTKSAGPGAWWDRSLSIQLDDGRWVVIAGGKGESTSEAQLLEWAQQLDFDGTMRIPAPIRLSGAPAGTALVEADWGSVSGDTGGTNDVRTDGAAYQFAASYQPPSAVGPNIGVSLVNGLPDNVIQNAQPLTVASRAAYWQQDAHRLTVAFGADAYITFGADFGTTTRDATEAELVAAAETVSLAPSLDDRSTWFDAAAALPLGG